MSNKKDKEELAKLKKSLGAGTESIEKVDKEGKNPAGARVKEMQKLKDGSKPDFLDFDKDGDKEESMKSALASKKTRTAKSGARTTMRGVKIAKKGFRKAKLS
jgi:hypothetical protein|tara:strand:+ start:61 stop:369 length:309 start_codon:yes stop_codon:yes gene_type:complete